MRRFVLVTATQTMGGRNIAGSGIRKLKRGIKLNDFVIDYLNAIETDQETMILERNGAWTAVRKTSIEIFTWTFTEYQEAELMTAVAHISRDELLRDLKELLPLRASE